MTKSEDLSERNDRQPGSNRRTSDSIDLNVVQLHDEGECDWVKATWQNWGEWWQKAAAEGMSQQHEAIEWWSRLAQCWAGRECRTQKALALGNRLLCASTAVSEAGRQLAVEQNHQMINLSREAQRVFQSGSPFEAQAFGLCFWQSVAGMARAWGMIPASGQARVAGAWAEFWSLPSADPGTE